MKHENSHKSERLARQRETEKALHAKKLAMAAIRERAEKAESNRILLVARNPVVECHRFDEFSKQVVPVRVPFAAMPGLYQQKIVAALMARNGQS